MAGTILVAGATGNTGRALVKRLAATGHPVRAATRNHRSLRECQAVEVVDVDYANPASLARALRAVDRVYLATPLATDMVVTTEQLVTAAVKAGVRHFVKLSGVGTQVPDAFQLARWHRAAEAVIEESGLTWTHLRPNAFMQNFTNHHLDSIRSQGLFHDPVGAGRVSYVDVDDIAAVAATVLTSPGHESKIYALTGPEAVSSYEAASHLSQASGRDIRCVEVSVEAARDALFGFGLPSVLVDAVSELYRFMRQDALSAVVSTIESVLGRPPTSFSRFAEQQRALLR